MEDGKWIEALITDFVLNSGYNLISPGSNERFWDRPLIGFSRGNDPYYSFFRKDIGDFYLPPVEFIKKEYEIADINEDSVTVISWVLPQTDKTRKENRKQRYYPSESWVRTRIYGDKFNKRLAGYITDEMKKNGIKAVAPMNSKVFEFKHSEKYGYASNWSERHAAFVSGLGTFGLCDGLITAAGKAMRCGAVVINSVVKPTTRDYSGYNDYCLYFSKGICMKCAVKCPAGAISPDGHDKIECREYQKNVILCFTRENYQIESTTCGLCQVGVPCESCIPMGLKQKERKSQDE